MSRLLCVRKSGKSMYHYRRKRNERVIQPSRLSDIASLERQLQAAAAHTETHRVHVDVVDQRRAILRLCVIHR